MTRPPYTKGTAMGDTVPHSEALPHAHRDAPPDLWSEIAAVLVEGAVFVLLLVVFCGLLIVLDAAR